MADEAGPGDGARRQCRRWFAWIAPLPAAACLVWPALWNGYAIVFADTGTYLSQAINHYAGWDRPVFYSLFMLPLHLTVTVWPVVVAQALITVWVLHLVCRALVPRLNVGTFVIGVALLSGGTWLPFLVSELMPDVFTPLLILVLATLAWTPERLSPAERWGLGALAVFMIVTQQSSVPLSIGLLIGLVPLSLGRRRTMPQLVLPGLRLPVPLLPVLLAPALAIIGLCTANLAAHGRFAVSPFGNIFLLARVIYDGPGMEALRRDCPASGWRLCPYLERFPPDSDSFLWTADSPLNLAGGPKMVSQDADAIIAAAVRADPVGELRAALVNALTQMRRFDSGDGLEPWPAQVTPWISRDFPLAERIAYAAARQQRGGLVLPTGLRALHRVVALLGVLGCAGLLPTAIKRRSPAVGLLLAVLLALPLSAAITGGLSMPHDRYQSRIMWLPPFAAVVGIAALCRDRSARGR